MGPITRSQARRPASATVSITRTPAQTTKSQPSTSTTPQYLNLLEPYIEHHRDLDKQEHLRLGFRLNTSHEEVQAGWMYCDDTTPCAYCVKFGKTCIIRPLRRDKHGMVVRARCMQCNRQTVPCSRRRAATLSEWQRQRKRVVAHGKLGVNNAQTEDHVHPSAANSTLAGETTDKVEALKTAEKQPAIPSTSTSTGTNRAFRLDNTAKDGPLDGPRSVENEDEERKYYQGIEIIEFLDSDDEDEDEDENSSHPSLSEGSSAGPSVRAHVHALPAADLPLFKAYAMAGIHEAVQNPIMSSALVSMSPDDLKARTWLDQWVLISILETGVVRADSNPPPSLELFKSYIECGVTAFMAGVVAPEIYTTTTKLSEEDICARAPEDCERIVAYLETVWPKSGGNDNM